MAEEAAQQLQVVEAELNQVQDQISTLALLEKSLLEQRDELQLLLESYGEANSDDKNGGKAGVSGSRDWSGAFEWDQRAADLCKNIFGISTYRTNQREIINAVMSGRDVIVIMAAGGGKSLCYQLPALLSHGLVLVVSPLLSLIQDQVMGLTALDIAAGMLTSTTSKAEEKSIYLSLEKGSGSLQILYVTPEKIAKSKRFMSKLEKCSKAGRLSLMAIDEAHCCSQWGHDFRPDYKNLGMLKTQFPKVPIMALTATATQRVQNDVKEMLHITVCERFVSSINRPNLFYEVRHKQGNASGAIDDIAEFIKREYSKKESGIVYCFTRRECEQVAKELTKRNISAAHYHATMEPNMKSKVHTRWSSNKIQVIVGTVAFGMGINKPDVRFVIHHSISKSLETYYQESGRAGRDGLPAHCLLFFRPNDLPRQSSMVFAEYAGLANLYAVARFCQSKRLCRHATFFRHFGEQAKDCNGMCDNCNYSKDVLDLDVTGPDSTLIKELTKDDVERVILQLLLDGLLKEEFQHTAYATNAYIALGANSRPFLSGMTRRKITLEVAKESKGKARSQPRGSAVADVNLQSGMAQSLDLLRQSLASSQGNIFPHSVLSSQHIMMLCASKPHSLDGVEKIIGKRKTERYGQAVIEAIDDYGRQNPSERLEQIGPWTNPKGPPKRDRQSPTSGVTRSPASEKSSGPLGKSRTEVGGSTPLTATGLSATEYVDLDSDSDDTVEPEPEVKPTPQGRKIGRQEWDEITDDDSDFVCMKRSVKRKR